MTTPQSGGAAPLSEEAAIRAFHEYEFLAEDTAKISDRRQTVNTLFVTINALFLTGVGYLLYQFFQAKYGGEPVYVYTFGFLAIAIITNLLNNAWLNLSEFYRRLIDLRIRYLEALERALQTARYFPVIDIPLKGKDQEKEDDYESMPNGPFNTEIQQRDANGVIVRRWMRTRGTYTFEGVLYHNPLKKKRPFGFTRAEQRIGHTFTWAYWLAFAVTALYVLPGALSFFGVHATIGPLHF